MFTRRDASKLLAAVGLAGATAEERHARAAVRWPAPAPAPAGTPRADDPAAFAGTMDAMLNWATGDDGLPSVAPDAEAAFLALRAEVERLAPFLADLHGRHPWGLLGDAAYDWATEAYVVGVRAGAAWEQLRRTALGPVRACPRCDGAPAGYCEACGGKGTVRDHGSGLLAAD